MTTPGVRSQGLIEEHSDFLRESVGDESPPRSLRPRSPARSAPARGGLRGSLDAPKRLPARPWATRVLEIALSVPRKRSGGATSRASLGPAREARRPARVS